MPPTPENYRYGGGTSDTVLHPLVLIALVIAALLIFLLPRKYVIAPFCFMAFLVPVGQVLYIGGIHLFVLRIVIVSGLMRAFLSRISGGPRFAGGFNGVDRAFCTVALAQSISAVLLFREAQMIVNQLGFLLDFAGGYLLLRFLIHDEEDVYRALKCFALITVPLAIGMEIEQRRGINIFGYLGGAALIPQIREGAIRSQGPFEHSLTAGTIAATMIPSIILLWRNAKSKIIGGLGFIGATTMMWTSSSSTPMLAYAAGIGSLFLFPIRKKMRTIRWGIVGGLIALQMVMKAPVWFLIGRVDVTGSSSGYHRAELVDQFIRHFFDWWLIGVKDSAQWGLDMFDVQNQYANVGESGGLLAFIFFIVLISRSFAMLGNARKAVDGDKNKEWMLWCLGSALFANVIGFLGMNYFDQSRIGWLMLLAVISAAAAPMLATKSSVPEGVAINQQIRYPWVRNLKESGVPVSSRNLGGRIEPHSAKLSLGHKRVE